MRKIKEVLRLRFGLGRRQEQSARSCPIRQAAVHRYLERAAALGLGWPLPEECDDQRLNELLFPTPPVRAVSPARPGVDFSQLHTQLQTHRHLTLPLLWEEYREVHPDGYGYSPMPLRYIRSHQSSSLPDAVVCGRFWRSGRF
jgi:transposase